MKYRSSKSAIRDLDDIFGYWPKSPAQRSLIESLRESPKDFGCWANTRRREESAMISGRVCCVFLRGNTSFIIGKVVEEFRLRTFLMADAIRSEPGNRKIESLSLD